MIIQIFYITLSFISIILDEQNKLPYVSELKLSVKTEAFRGTVLGEFCVHYISLNSFLLRAMVTNYLHFNLKNLRFRNVKQLMFFNAGH